MPKLSKALMIYQAPDGTRREVFVEQKQAERIRILSGKERGAISALLVELVERLDGETEKLLQRWEREKRAKPS